MTQGHRRNYTTLTDATRQRGDRAQRLGRARRAERGHGGTHGGNAARHVEQAVDGGGIEEANHHTIMHRFAAKFMPFIAL